ncbi:MAG TPA: VOC family protein [Acidobacteriota bacterium]|nr:VOC family protein [Acidobacteriota bacterium]
MLQQNTLNVRCEMHRFALAALLILAVAVTLRASDEDIWQPFRPLVGEWSGAGEGMSGHSEVTTRIEFDLGGRFIKLSTTAVFAPQEKNPDGEVHEDVGFISYDKARKKYVFRQFHVEGFINRYVLQEPEGESGELVFVSEDLENAPPGWQAKVTYELDEAGELLVGFHLSTGGKDFKCYSLNRMKRSAIGGTEMKSLTANLMVSDVNETVDFYREVLGYRLVMSVPESGTLDWAMMSNGGAEIMFQSCESLSQEYPAFKGTQVGGSFVLFVTMDGIDEFYQNIKGKAKVVIELHDTFYGMREFAVEDNNGYVLTFAEELQQ